VAAAAGAQPSMGVLGCRAGVAGAGEEEKPPNLPAGRAVGSRLRPEESSPAGKRPALVPDGRR
jgi:hypothetical protein